METKQLQQLDDIKAIREMMTKASKFLSLSGLSGISAGAIAVVGGLITLFYLRVYAPVHGLVFEKGLAHPDFRRAVIFVSCMAFVVLIGAAVSAMFFTVRKSKRLKKIVLDNNAIRILVSIFLPLSIAGALSIVLLIHNDVYLIAPTMLLLYGIGVVNASTYTFRDTAYLGYSEVALGLLALVFPALGLEIWILGFGVMHIVYGAVMYAKYDHR